MTIPDTKAIRALKSKRSKCADIGTLDLSNVPESHETIWLQWGYNGGDDDTWCADLCRAPLANTRPSPAPPSRRRRASDSENSRLENAGRSGTTP